MNNTIKTTRIVVLMDEREKAMLDEITKRMCQEHSYLNNRSDVLRLLINEKHTQLASPSDDLTSL